MAMMNGPNGWQDPVARLAELSQKFAPNANGGPFDTGLASNDFDGYVQRLKDQQEYEGLKAMEAGQAPPKVQTFQSAGDPYGLDRATGERNSSVFGQPTPAGVSGADVMRGLRTAVGRPDMTHEQWMAQMAPRFGRNKNGEVQ